MEVEVEHVFLGASKWEVKNKIEENGVVVEGLECLVRGLTFILLEQCLSWCHLWPICMKINPFPIAC